MKKITLLILGIVGGLILAMLLRSFFTQSAARTTHDVIRVGHMTNVTHLQAMIGRNRGDFEKAFGPEVKIEWKVFTAGASMMTALLAGELDLVYVGPNPAVNAYLRSEGEAIRVLAGATTGGSGLVARADFMCRTQQDFNGKRVATPEIGNTQDVACRFWLKEGGMLPREKGGEVSVVPASGADQRTLLLQNKIDAAWVAEPWLSRLIHEAGARLVIDERDLWPDRKYITTLLAVRKDYLDRHPDRVKRWLEVHIALTDWIRTHPEEAAKLANDQFQQITTRKLSPAVLQDAMSRIEVISDPLESTLQEQARRAYEIGFLGKVPPRLDGLVDRSLLNEVKGEEARSKK